jgi:hypothetical protein
MRVVALLASYNEERFIGGCIEHLSEQGVEAYLIDNCSTDNTVDIAKEYLGHGLIGIETLERTDGLDRLKVRLRRKDELATTLDADWFMHMDPDEIRLAPDPSQTLAEALEGVDYTGYNAVNFQEFTFIPTRESPEHDHRDFQKTMRWYYPFARRFPRNIKAWKKQPEPIELEKSGGHRPSIPDLMLYPEPFKMRHYQFLSLEQAREKYLQNKKFDRSKVTTAYWRGWLVEERMGLSLPSESELNTYTSDEELSLSNPRIRHVMEDWALPESERVEGNIPGTAGRGSSDPGAAADFSKPEPPSNPRGSLRAENQRLRRDNQRLRKRYANQQRRREAEEARLVNWLQQLDHDVVALLNSRRWKIGEKIGKTLDAFRRKPGQGTAADSLQRVLKDFRAWRFHRGD